MADNSDIFVRFGADIEGLKKGANEATNLLEGVGKSAISSAKGIASVTAAAAAAGAALLVIANNSAEAAREIKTLSMLSGVGVAEFQNMAFAAKTVGVEQEKLADIFKDSQDKIGDFVANGGGPLIDFFDNVGAKVGVTKKDFAGLSGHDALGLYVSSLEKANLSQAEMVFYMEAIASDSAKLLPLLKNNGSEFKNLSNQADELGIALSSVDIETLDRMKKSTDSVVGVFGSIVDKISVEFAPLITEVSKRILKAGKDSGFFAEAAHVAFSSVIKTVGFLGNTIRGIEVIIAGLKVAFHGVATGVAFVSANIIGALDKLRIGAIEIINGIIGAANNIPGIKLNLISTEQSDLAKSFYDDLSQSIKNTQDATDALHAKLMEPLPSEMIESVVAAVKLKNDAEIAEDQRKNDELAAQQKESNKKALEGQMTFGQKWARINAMWKKEDKEGTQQFFSDLSVLTQSGNKRLFEIGKMAAATNVIIDTQEAAMKAYNWAAGWGGPVAGGIAAGAAIAAGGIRLQAINSTSFGGGGSVGGSGGGGAQASATSAQPQAQPQQTETQRTIRLESLDPTALVSGAMINTLAKNLVDLQNDGFKLVV